MKTIIVLTDFSKASRNAANSAIKIAEQFHLDILLVHSYLFPFASSLAVAEGRSLVDSSLLASDSQVGLKKEVRRIKRLMDKNTNSSFKPIIKVYSSIESVPQAISKLAGSFEISLMIIGSHHTTYPSIFSAIDIETLLDNQHCPILIVPKHHSCNHISDLVFATDLHHDSLKLLRSIKTYAKAYHFRIHVCHVSKPVFVPDFIEEDKISKFTANVAFMGRNNITFTDLKGRNVGRALDEFNQTIGADMLAIIYNPHSFAYKLLHGDHTSKLVKKQKLPLLIVPSTLLKIS